MLEQFENPHATRLEDETFSDSSPLKRIDSVAEMAAEKSTRAVLLFDKDNRKLFSK